MINHECSSNFIDHQNNDKRVDQDQLMNEHFSEGETDGGKITREIDTSYEVQLLT